MKTHHFAFWLAGLSSALLSAPLDATAQSHRVDNLGALLGTNSYALGINNQAQVVGYWLAPDGARAFLYDLGKVTDLGSLGDTNNFALSVNDSGQVVGFSETSEGLSAFLFQNGKGSMVFEFVADGAIGKIQASANCLPSASFRNVPLSSAFPIQAVSHEGAIERFSEYL